MWQLSWIYWVLLQTTVASRGSKGFATENASLLVATDATGCGSNLLTRNEVAWATWKEGSGSAARQRLDGIKNFLSRSDMGWIAISTTATLTSCFQSCYQSGCSIFEAILDIWELFVLEPFQENDRPLEMRPAKSVTATPRWSKDHPWMGWLKR